MSNRSTRTAPGQGERPASARGSGAPGKITRYEAGVVCPICGGADRDPRGRGVRCAGFISSDGLYARCTRPEKAGGLPIEERSQPAAYVHRLNAECKCGRSHGHAAPEPDRKAKPKWTAPGPVEAEFIYRDAEGFPYLKVTRYRTDEGKTFRQSIPTARPSKPDARVRWVAGVGKRAMIPYRLPELVGSDGATVYIVEGERKVDALEASGRIATCNPMGAGKWRDDLSPHLAGRHVVILPDNDKPGRSHAEKVATSIYTHAATVKIVELPGLPPKGDIVDWLGSGRTVAEMEAIASTAPAWTPAVEQNGHAPSSNGHAPAPSPPIPPPDDAPINRTDLGNARRLVKWFGTHLRYCQQWGSWLVWDGKRWREDRTGDVQRKAKNTVRTIAVEAGEAEDDDERKALLRWALESESKKRLDAMIGLAWSEPGIAIEADKLNADPWLLNCSNGTVDLRTGLCRKPRQSDLISKLAPVDYEPSAACPKWLAFLDKIMAGDQELIGFLRRAAGYALTGDVSEHALFFLYGTGRNGKGTFLETLLAILGDYATTIDTGLITVKRNEDHLTGLTDLDGARFVPTEEVEDGKRLAEALVKKLTGGNRIKARRMRMDHYEFNPTYKIFLAANHAPEIRGTDEGIWSRVKMIPFDVFIPPEERVRNFGAMLVREEGPGILAWAVRGCLEWQRDGLKEPDAVVEATSSYRESMDAIGEFIAECCESFLDHPTLKTQVKVKKDDLYHSYIEWSKTNGCERTLSARKFGGEMEKRRYALQKSNGKYYRLGISLKASAEGDGSY